jgi:hypothetical protein
VSTLGELQRHMDSRDLALPKTASELHRQLRKLLFRAVDERLLSSQIHDINANFVCISAEEDLATKLLVSKSRRGFVIGIADKNQERSRASKHFVRRDNCWFDCSFTVIETSEGLQLAAYSLELRLCPGMGVPFVRYDLNPPGHANELRELRCHMHPGSDDIMLPAPLMTPAELLTHFVTPATTFRKQRTPTEFELDWLRETHSSLVK